MRLLIVLGLFVGTALALRVSSDPAAPVEGTAPRASQPLPDASTLNGAAKARSPRREARSSHERASRSDVRVLRKGQRLDITAYCWTGSRNAAGDWPTVGTAAANGYPLGTHLLIGGIGEVVVADRSAPGATDVDVYLGRGPACEQRARAFGRQLRTVEVL